MPVCLYPDYAIACNRPRADWYCVNRAAICEDRWTKCVDIGLINNMADGALEATERQFFSLLESASDGILVRLSLYSLPHVPRNETGSRHTQDFYLSTEELWNRHLDGLITTGREPLTANLPDEPYWQDLTKVLGWARENTYSSVWSCLAAHAAILHMDGISRVRSSEKYFGVYECDPLAVHCLTSGVRSRLRLPHSRWNGISEDALTDSGYRVLTRANGAGVDTFVKHDKCMFVFFQGHPEYESNTLLLEYRRDAGRYLKRETDKYPSMPQGYFAPETAQVLTSLRDEALASRRDELLTDVSAALANAKIDNTWRATATRTYRNWLEYLWAQKEQRSKAKATFPELTDISNPMPVLAT